MSQQMPFDERDESDEPYEAQANEKDNHNRRAAAATATAEPSDLSEEVVRSVERRPGEQVTCRRVGEHHYRCNWWTLQSTAAHDNPGMKGPLVSTSRISQSEFLHVTRAGARLKIRVDTRTAARRGFWFGA
jgi:hypothetical protein